MVGRGGGDRKNELLNKALALYALQLRLLSNWNKMEQGAISTEVRSSGMDCSAAELRPSLYLIVLASIEGAAEKHHFSL